MDNEDIKPQRSSAGPIDDDRDTGDQRDVDPPRQEASERSVYGSKAVSRHASGLQHASSRGHSFSAPVAPPAPTAVAAPEAPAAPVAAPAPTKPSPVFDAVDSLLKAGITPLAGEVELCSARLQTSVSTVATVTITNRRVLVRSAGVGSAATTKNGELKPAKEPKGILYWLCCCCLCSSSESNRSEEITYLEKHATDMAFLTDDLKNVSVTTTEKESKSNSTHRTVEEGCCACFNCCGCFGCACCQVKDNTHQEEKVVVSEPIVNLTIDFVKKPGNLVPSWSWDPALKTSYYRLHISGEGKREEVAALRAALFNHPDYLRASTVGDGAHQVNLTLGKGGAPSATSAAAAPSSPAENAAPSLN